MRAVHAYVTGRVQGVFFRTTTRDRAEQLGLEGWVRNLPDGRVQVFFQGPDQAVARLEEFLRRGPSRAEVDGVETEDLPPDHSLSGFQIRYG